MYGRSILQNLLKTHPEHAAVHHYWIHAAENGPHPEEALDSAEKLVKLAPNSGHMLHMPGHIYYRIGMYEKARAAFLTSFEFDLKYMRENKIHPINNWNYTHNLDYLVANCAEEGRYKEAAMYAQMLLDIPSDEARARSTGLGYLLYGGDTAMTRLQMRFGKWDAAAADVENQFKKDDPSLSGKYASGLLSYLKGMSAVERGDAAGAGQRLEELLNTSDVMAGLRGQVGSDWYFGYASKILAVHILDLRGSLLSLKGENAEAEKVLLGAVDRERDLGYWEPPHYTRPVLESLAAAYIRSGKLDDALDAFQKILVTRPNSGFAYLGMVRVFEKKGDIAKVAAARKQLAAAWKNADKDLPAIKLITK